MASSLGIRRLTSCLLISCFAVDLVVAPCSSSDPPSWVWPLGKGIGVLEVMTNTTQGNHYNVDYMPTPASLGSYEAMVFQNDGLSYAYVDVPALSQVDFVIQFYVYLNDINDGTLLSYLGDLPLNLTHTIYEFNVYLTNGNIEIEVTGYGIHQFNTSSLVSNVWYHVALQRDMSKKYFSVYLDGGNEVQGNDLLIDKIPLSSPGTLRFGNKFTIINPMDGALACVQLFPCKAGIDTSHASLCNSNNWPVEPTTISTSTTSTTPTSTISTSTSTTSTTPSSTISTSTSTTSTTPSSTISTSTSTTSTTPTSTISTSTSTTSTTPTSTISTSTSTTSTTPSSTISTSTSTTSTTPTSTISTSTSTTSTTPSSTISTSTSTTSTTPTSTVSTSTSTTSTTPSTTPTSTRSSLVTQTLFPALNVSIDDQLDTCMQFDRIAIDAAYENIVDIIHSENVEEFNQCAMLCFGHTNCLSFTIKNNLTPYECKLSSVRPISTIFETGSELYQVR